MSNFTRQDHSNCLTNKTYQKKKPKVKKIDKKEADVNEPEKKK